MNETYNNIQINIMPLHTPLIPGFGSKGQNFFSSESGHVVYLLKGDSNPNDKYVLSERAL